MNKKCIIILAVVLIIAVIISGIYNIFKVINHHIRENQFHNMLIEQINKRCPFEKGQCEINLAEVTDFKWDKLIIYSYGTFERSILNEMGFDCNFSKDFMHCGAIFILNDTIVFHDRLSVNPEDLFIGFQYITRSNDCVVYYPENAVVNGEKVTLDGNICYSISPIEIK